MQPYILTKMYILSVYLHVIWLLPCVHTATGESVKVAGSHSFSMWAGGELRWVAARRVLDGVGIEESWSQVNFMVMSYDAVRRQPIGM